MYIIAALQRNSTLKSLHCDLFGVDQDEEDDKDEDLCVRRAEYIDPNTGEKDPAKQGVCSKFLCEVSPGDEVSVAAV